MADHFMKALSAIVLMPLACAASTYRLSYDAIVSPLTVVQHAANPLNKHPEDQTRGLLVPPTIAEETTKNIGVALFTQWVDFKHALGENTVFSGENVSLGLNCFPQEVYGEDLNSGTICVMDHSSPGFSFQISTTVFQAEGSIGDYTSNEETAEDEVPVAVRLDVTISANTKSIKGATYARDALVEIVPVINDDVSAILVPGPLWVIEERRSPLEMHRRMDVRSPQTLQNPASLEAMVLSNTAALWRIPVVSSSKKIRKKPEPTVESDVNMVLQQDIHPDADIWQYQELGAKDATRALFLDSTLRTITNGAGHAHSEAFVHPAMLSHLSGENILVISETPLSYVRELLKYASTDYVSVVGADMAALKMTKSYMPQLDDCSMIEGRSDSCIEDDVVEINEDIVDSWLDSMIEEIEEENIMTECILEEEDYYCSLYPQFDVILVDVSGSEKEWFSTEFHHKLQLLMSDESIVIVNSGLTPSMDRDFKNNGSDHSTRDEFLFMATKSKETGGVGYGYAHVYDEALAAPLDTAYIALFKKSDPEVLYSFLQKNPTSKDTDFVFKMLPQATPPTLYYDGIAHGRYIVPARTWENWYCNTSPVKNQRACDTFLSDWYNIEKHSYTTEVKRHPVKGRSLFTSTDIPKGNFVLPNDSYLSVQLDHFQWEYLNEFVSSFPDASMFKDLRDFFEIYGFETYGIGAQGWSVSFTNNTFTNHACTEQDATVVWLDSVHTDKGGEWLGFSPFVSRRSHTLVQLVVAARDLTAGEEIMVDYKNFRPDDPEFEDWLNSVCTTGVGRVPVDVDNNEL